MGNLYVNPYHLYEEPFEIAIGEDFYWIYTDPSIPIGNVAVPAIIRHKYNIDLGDTMTIQTL
jgi:hypothetical protein